MATKVKAVKTEGGYVHFTDGKRVVYTTKGATGQTNGWFPITPTHIRLANDFLVASGIVSTGE